MTEVHEKHGKQEDPLLLQLFVPLRYQTQHMLKLQEELQLQHVMFFPHHQEGCAHHYHSEIPHQWQLPQTPLLRQRLQVVKLE